MHESEPVNPCVEKTTALVFETFRGVTREGGVSWSESIVLDRHLDEDELREAGLEDKEFGWEELANDPDWEPFSGSGGFSFLDPIGSRYYLAPTMVKELRGHEGRSGSLLNILHRQKRLRGYPFVQWSALQPDEIQCVCEFLKCMITIWDYPPDPEVDYLGDDSWEVAYRSHWVNLDANPLPG